MGFFVLYNVECCGFYSVLGGLLARCLVYGGVVDFDLTVPCMKLLEQHDFCFVLEAKEKTS